MNSLNLNTVCPHCKLAMDQCTGVSGAFKPVEGDLSMCFSCGGFAHFDKNLMLVELTTDQLVDLPASPRQELLKAHELWVSEKEKYDAFRRHKK